MKPQNLFESSALIKVIGVGGAGCNDKFGSRKGIEEGSITLHPLGIPHGPQPGAVEASMPHKRTEELAVMMDTFGPLRIAKASLDIEDPDYWKSWQTTR